MFALLTTHEALAIHSNYVHLVTHGDDPSFLDVIVTGQVVSRDSIQVRYKITDE